VGTRSRYTFEDGYCDIERRTIYIRDDLARDVDARRDALLLHECVHAVTGAGHGRGFRRRLRMCADRARELGDAALANELVAKLEELACTPTARASTIYRMVEEFVEDRAIEPDFEAVLKALSRETGLTPQELLVRYSRLHRIYAEAIGNRTAAVFGDADR